MRSIGRFSPALMAALLVAGVVAFSLFAARYLTILGVAENYTSAWFASLFEPFRPQHPDIVILTISERTLEQFPFRSPIDRGYLAQTLEILAQRQVRAVGMDILFDQATVAEADARFQAVARSFPAPLAVGWTDEATQLTERQYAFQAQFLDGIRAGYVNLEKDSRDGTVRVEFPGREEGGVWRSSLSAVLAEALGVEQRREPMRIRYRLGPDLETSPFRTFPIESAAALPAAWLKDKIVLIGADLPFEDRHRTPMVAVWGNEKGTLPGLFIQAHMLAQRLDGTAGAQRNTAIEAGVALVLALAALGLALWERPAPVQMAAAGAVIALLWAATAWLYWRTGIAVPVIAPSTAFAIGLFAAVGYMGHRRRLQGQFVREAFSRYVAPGVVKKLEANPDQLVLGGDKRDISVIFTDIEGFTTFAEKQEPTALIGFLNRYLDTLCAEVERHGGMVDKFIGDAVMAIFGAPELQADHASRALACAQAMQAAGANLQADFAAQGIHFGRTRIGLHSGAAVVGNVGGQRRFDYTAIGDVVNTAARLEGANKYFGTDICISGPTRQAAGGDARLRPIGSLVLKGREQGLPVFTAAGAMPDEQLARYDAAYARMAAGDGDALGAFEAYLKDYPADPLAAFHRQRLADGETSDLIVLEGK